MAAKKKQKRKTVILVNAADSAEFARTIVHRIATAEVKTATPSRAQNKIQVRIAWAEPGGKPGLGYLSMYSTAAEKAGRGNGPLLKDFLDEVFRVVQWAKHLARKEGCEADWGAYHEDLHADLSSLGVFNTTGRLHEIHTDSIAAIYECAKSGIHLSVRKTKNQEKAKKYLDSCIQFALQNGMKDDEINEIIKLAFVKHTMES